MAKTCEEAGPADAARSGRRVVVVLGLPAAHRAVVDLLFGKRLVFSLGRSTSHERPLYAQLERVLGQVAAARRRERTTERRITSSGIQIRGTLGSFDLAFQPKLSHAAIEEFAGLGFIQRSQNLLIFTSGTGLATRNGGTYGSGSSGSGQVAGSEGKPAGLRLEAAVEAATLLQDFSWPGVAWWALQRALRVSIPA